MRTRRGCKRIKLVYRRSFRRPVRVRVEAEPLLSADRITPDLPAGILLFTPSRSLRLAKPGRRFIHVELAAEPDWRIVGDQDAEPGPTRDLPW